MYVFVCMNVALFLFFETTFQICIQIKSKNRYDYCFAMRPSYSIQFRKKQQILTELLFRHRQMCEYSCCFKTEHKILDINVFFFLKCLIFVLLCISV